MSNESSHRKRAFAFRFGYVGLFRLICILMAPREPKHLWGHLFHALGWSLPFDRPLISRADWQWLSHNPPAVNRWGLRVRR